MADAEDVPWWKNEDWLAVFAALPLLLLVILGVSPRMPALGWTGASDVGRVLTARNLTAAAAGLAIFVGTSALVLAPTLRRGALGFVPRAAVVLVLAFAAQWLAANASLRALGLEYVLFALAVGLVVGASARATAWLGDAVRTELYIKIGIVLLGSTIRFPDLLDAGLPGLLQALLVIPVVFRACHYLAKKLDVDEELSVMMATAVSICGVSAAIAACGAIRGDKKKLSYVTSLVLVCAVPMMVAMPWIVRALHLPEDVAGAWIGGTLDTSGSVAAATELVGERATETGMVVKLSQNVLIGVAAFALSLWWAARKPSGSDAPRERPTLGYLWERFPKFALGFIAASLGFSFAIGSASFAQAKPIVDGLRGLFFAAAFVCIGLETKLGAIATLGRGRPALAFVGAQLVNVVWTLVLALLLFGDHALQQ